jgi:hypothetical protein
VFLETGAPLFIRWLDALPPDGFSAILRASRYAFLLREEWRSDYLTIPVAGFLGAGVAHCYK